MLLLRCDAFEGSDLFQHCSDFLASDRMKKIETCRFIHDKYESAGAGYLAQYLLITSGFYSDDLYFDDDGKPLIKGNRAFFSLSHSYPWVIAAISDTPIGIDIEKKDPALLDLMNHICTPEEIQFLNSVNDDDKSDLMMTIFSEKECMIKRDGINDFRCLSTLHPVNKGEFKQVVVDGYTCIIYGKKGIYCEIQEIPFARLQNFFLYSE